MLLARTNALDEECSQPAATDERSAHVRVAGRARDPNRCDLRVQVVDERGWGVPFAVVALSAEKHVCPPSWIDEVEGVQRLDPFTDHQGVRTWHGLEPGTWSVSAAWAGRKAHTNLQLEPGRLVEVEVCPHQGE